MTKETKKTKKWDVNWFINKLSKIPSKFWITSNYEKRKDGQRYCCALGWCGGNRRSKESYALKKILRNVIAVNDAIDIKYLKFGKTPKERVLKALRAVRDGINLNDLIYRSKTTV